MTSEEEQTKKAVAAALENARFCLGGKHHSLTTSSIQNFKRKDKLSYNEVTTLVNNPEDEIEWLNTIICFAAKKLANNEERINMAKRVASDAKKYGLEISQEAIVILKEAVDESNENDIDNQSIPEISDEIDRTPVLPVPAISIRAITVPAIPIPEIPVPTI